MLHAVGRLYYDESCTLGLGEKVNAFFKIQGIINGSLLQVQGLVDRLFGLRI